MQERSWLKSRSKSAELVAVWWKRDAGADGATYGLAALMRARVERHHRAPYIHLFDKQRTDEAGRQTMAGGASS